MAITWECDYCGQTIYRENGWVRLQADDRGGYSKDDLNRMGLNSKVARRVEQSFCFHAACFEQTVRLLDDHRAWAELAEEREDSLPRWLGDELTEPIPPDPPDPGEEWKRKWDAANQADGVGNLSGLSHQTYMALIRAGLVKVEDVRSAYLDGKLGDVPDIGPKRIMEIQGALLTVGFRV